MALNTFDYKNLIDSKEATIQVHLSNPYGTGDVMFIGLLTSELGISCGANYESLMDTSAQEALSKKATLLNNLTEGAISSGDIRLVTFPQTSMSYINSDKIKFSVDCVLVAVNKTDSPLNEWKKLLRTVNPRYGEIAKKWGGVMQSPTNYRYHNDGTASGTASIRYSTWFWSRNQLITNVNFTASKAVTSTGTPLYVHGTIQFEPFRALEQDELIKYFVV